MRISKVGAQIVINECPKYPGQEFDITSMHARMKVTSTTTVITDLANPNQIYTDINANIGDGSGIQIGGEAEIKAYLRPIIGS